MDNYFYACMICSVFHLAGEFARHLQRQAKSDFPNKMEGNKFALFTDEEVMCVEIAGLCHDLGNNNITVT